MRTGPRSTLNELPCSTWALRSAIATQTQTAGGICTSRSRRFEMSSFRPSKSSAKAPTANTSGANTRRRVAQADDRLLDLGLVALLDRLHQRTHPTENAVNRRVCLESRIRLGHS